MSSSGTILDILIFAAIAVFLVFRLRAVLGRRTGEERQRPNPFAQPDPATVAERQPIPFPGNPPVALPPTPVNPDEPQSLDVRINRLRTADPSFDEKHFLAGAKSAFPMIVEAYAEGDEATLRPLLAPAVFEDFSAAIENRRREGIRQVTSIQGPVEADLHDARVEDGTTFVEVRFVSSQINATEDASGKVIDGNAAEPTEIVDLWTFARELKAKDPNWQLVATGNGA